MGQMVLLIALCVSMVSAANQVTPPKVGSVEWLENRCHGCLGVFKDELHPCASNCREKSGAIKLRQHGDQKFCQSCLTVVREDGQEVSICNKLKVLYTFYDSHTTIHSYRVYQGSDESCLKLYSKINKTPDLVSEQDIFDKIIDDSRNRPARQPPSFIMDSKNLYRGIECYKHGDKIYIKYRSVFYDVTDGNHVQNLGGYWDKKWNSLYLTKLMEGTVKKDGIVLFEHPHEALLKHMRKGKKRRDLKFTTPQAR